MIPPHTSSPSHWPPFFPIIHHSITPSYTPPLLTPISRLTPHPPQPRTPTIPPPPHLHLLSLFLPPPLHHQQIPNLLITRTPVPNLLTINTRFPSPRISSFLHFPLTGEIGTCYVEAVDMAGDHAGDEEERVEYAVHAWSCYQHY